jgi:stalled ribosome rescue protein Dom34
MSAILVWVHQDQAKLFHLKANSIHVESVQYKGPKHPIETHGKNHPQNQTDSEAFFRQLTDVLSQKGQAKWLIMGPSLGPQHFFRHLENHHPNLAAYVIGVERVARMPDSEILSVGRQFLHNYYLYHGVAN